MIVSLKPVLKRPNIVPQRRNTVAVRKVFRVKNDLSLSDAVELTGKCLGAYVLFTSSLNWLFYRRINKSIEQSKKDNDK